MDLSGSSVILTGASGGIGSALALELVARGAEVLAIGRRAEALSAVAAGAVAPERIRALVADITVSEGRTRVLEAAETLARPVLLVHAAGIGGFGLFAEGSDAASVRLFDTNLLAPLVLSRALLPLLARQPDAAVVAIGSTFGSIGFPGFAEYSASKFALRGLMEALAREHADGPVRFQWLAPRATDTAFNSDAVRGFNRDSGTRVDTPQVAARALADAICARTTRQQLGWPEKLFVRINGALPGLVDRALRRTLPLVRRHATLSTTPVLENPDVAS